MDLETEYFVPTLRLKGYTDYTQNSELIACYKKDGNWVELGRGSYQGWDKPPYPFEFYVENPPAKVVNDRTLIKVYGPENYPPKD